MHLLKIDESGALYDSDEAVDLAQPPAEIGRSTSTSLSVSSRKSKLQQQQQQQQQQHALSSSGRSVGTTACDEAAGVAQAIGVWKTQGRVACVFVQAGAGADERLAAAVSAAKVSRSAVLLVLLDSTAATAAAAAAKTAAAVKLTMAHGDDGITSETDQTILETVCKSYYTVQSGSAIMRTLLTAAKAATAGTVLGKDPEIAAPARV